MSSHRAVLAVSADPAVSGVANRCEIHQRHRLTAESLARDSHGGVKEIPKAPPYQQFNSFPKHNIHLSQALGAVVNSSITVG